MQAHTQERKAGGIEPPGEFVDRSRTRRGTLHPQYLGAAIIWWRDTGRTVRRIWRWPMLRLGTSMKRHPIGDAIDAVTGRTFRQWPLDCLGGDDRTAFDNRGFAGRLVVHRLPSWTTNLGPVKHQPPISQFVSMFVDIQIIGRKPHTPTGLDGRIGFKNKAIRERSDLPHHSSLPNI